MKIRLRKLAMGFILGASITLTSVLGYATVTYVMNKTVDSNITVGDTTVVSDGLIIELVSHDDYTLTFYDIAESGTQRHYLTYTYSYEILVDNMVIEVSSLSTDITVTELTYTDTTIAITFSLNQEMTFNDGDILNIQFYFEAVEIPAININNTTIEALQSIGFTESEAAEIVALTYNVADLVELYGYIYIADIHVRFDSLVTDGTIVFE